MKKVYVILLGMILAFCGNVFAGDINDVSSDKWLDHVAQMQVMRQQILNLLTRENPTPEDKEMLSALQKSFDEKKVEWDQYLIDVAEGRIKGNKPASTFCTDCGKKLCDCGKGIDCKKCGKKVCNCAKACTDKKMGKECSSCKKGAYHRYNKKPRRNFKGEYHRYKKSCKDECADKCKSLKKTCKEGYADNCKSLKKDCKDGYADKCKSDKMKSACKTVSCGSKCPSEKKQHKMAMKKAKKSACGSCPSAKKSACASAVKEIKCNEGVDCKKCPKYKTDKCCKVSGKCSSGHNHGVIKGYKKSEKKMKSNKMSCPVCYEYKIMGINKKCAKCSK